MLTQAISDRVITAVGDPNDTLTVALVGVWPFCQATAVVDARLPELYAQQAMIDVRLAEEVQSTDFTVAEDVKDAQSAIFDHLKEKRNLISDDILRIEAVSMASRGPRQVSLSTVDATNPDLLLNRWP